jgi:Flp pilus assembly protein TadG
MLHILRSLRGLAARFRGHSSGSLTPTFAVSMVPLLALVGTAVDFSHMNNVRSNLQAALDAAVLAGARDDTATWIQTANNVFTGAFQPKGSSVATPSFVLNGDGSFTGSVTALLPTDFLGALGISSVTVKATSTAMVAPTNPQREYCLLALNLTVAQSMKVAGNGDITITAPSCVMQVNSNDPDAVDLSGNAAVNTVENCFVGGLVTRDHSTITPLPDAKCTTLPDPFANYTRPPIGACDPALQDYKLSGNKTVTLYPGVYCGGMNFDGNVNVTFAPDPNNASNNVFIIKDSVGNDAVIQETGGTFTTLPGASNGVSFFFTGRNAAVKTSGQANWHLVAPTIGPMAGFAIFLDPNGPSGAAAAESDLAGQSELYFEGVVYLPKQLVKITGTAEAFAPSPWTAFIADTFQITGNGSIVIHNDTSLTAVPIPAGLKNRTGGRLWLMQ